MLSSPPDTTQRPSGVNRMALTPRVWPLYVWIHPFFLISHILRLVSREPDAKNSPKGWKSTDIQLDLWPVSVRTTAYKMAMQEKNLQPSNWENGFNRPQHSVGWTRFSCSSKEYFVKSRAYSLPPLSPRAWLYRLQLLQLLRPPKNQSWQSRCHWYVPTNSIV